MNKKAPQLAEMTPKITATTLPCIPPTTVSSDMATIEPNQKAVVTYLVSIQFIFNVNPINLLLQQQHGSS
ncbi:hypothetical protein [Pseudomonas syringae]|uniref:hypothetical protein n=1 Tax=Pseudomonas syringae TaxID=317 RepID=UPI0015E1943A|nr:hypothetical protein [Pseudomonas syringae]